MYILKIKNTNNRLFKTLSNTFKLTNKGGVKSYIGMNASKYPNGTITTSQPAIINKILNTLRICDESKMHDTTANVILKKDEMEMGGSKNGTIVKLLVMNISV